MRALSNKPEMDHLHPEESLQGGAEALGCGRADLQQGALYGLGAENNLIKSASGQLSPTSSTILPMWAPDSISTWAAAAPASGNTLKITGRIFCASIRGHIFSRSAAAMALLNSMLRGRKVEGGYGQAPPQDSVEVHLGLAAAEQGNNRQAPVVGQTLQLARHVVTGDHVQNHVNPFTGGELLDHLHEILGAVIDGSFGAKPLAGRTLLGTAGSRKNTMTQRPRHLNRGDADPAGAALHQQRLALSQAAAFKDIDPNRERGLR